MQNSDHYGCRASAEDECRGIRGTATDQLWHCAKPTIPFFFVQANGGEAIQVGNSGFYLAEFEKVKQRSGLYQQLILTLHFHGVFYTHL